MRFLVILLTFFLSSLHGGGFNRDNDFQVWIYDGVHTKLSKRTSLYLESELRYGDNASLLYFYYLQTRFFFSPCKWLDIAPGYRQIFSLRSPEDHTWRPIYNPLTDVIFKKEFRKWEFSDRSRFQYLIFEDEKNAWLYRNRLQIRAPWKIGRIGIHPQISNELFFRERRGFAQNRFAVGGIFPLAKKIEGSLQYMLRSLKDIEGNWRNHHICWIYFDIEY